MSSTLYCTPSIYIFQFLRYRLKNHVIFYILKKIKSETLILCYSRKDTCILLRFGYRFGLQVKRQLVFVLQVKRQLYFDV
jgi:hypothetical protein